MKEYSISDVNQMDRAEFVAAFGGVYELSEWIAEKAWVMRPFKSTKSLLASFRTVLKQSADETKLELLCAHPELAGKEARKGELTKESENEQASAGLNKLTADEMKYIKEFNALYLTAFKFPFIIAVKNHTKAEIFAHMAARIRNCVEDEFDIALSQVNEIARIRLSELVQSGTN